MNKPGYNYIAAIGAIGLALYGVPAFSAHAPNIVAGTVTSVQARSIVVNGVSYDVQLQGGALRELGQVHVGDRVQLVLNRAHGAAATQVSTIRLKR